MPQKFGNFAYNQGLYGLEQTRAIAIEILTPTKGQKLENSETEVKIVGSVRDSELRYGIEKVEVKVKRVKTLNNETEYWTGASWQTSEVWINLGGPTNATAEIWNWETAIITFNGVPATFHIWVKAVDNQGFNTTTDEGLDTYSFFQYQTPVPEITMDALSGPLDYQAMPVNGYEITGTAKGGYVTAHSQRELVDRIYIRFNEGNWIRMTSAQITPTGTTGEYNWNYKWLPSRDGEIKIEAYCLSSSKVSSTIIDQTIEVNDAIVPTLSIKKAVPDYINQGVKLTFDAKDNLGIVKYIIKEVVYPYATPDANDPAWVNVNFVKDLKKEERVIF